MSSLAQHQHDDAPVRCPKSLCWPGRHHAWRGWRNGGAGSRGGAAEHGDCWDCTSPTATDAASTTNLTNPTWTWHPSFLQDFVLFHIHALLLNCLATNVSPVNCPTSACNFTSPLSTNFLTAVSHGGEVLSLCLGWAAVLGTCGELVGYWDGKLRVGEAKGKLGSGITVTEKLTIILNFLWFVLTEKTRCFSGFSCQWRKSVQATTRRCRKCLP